MFDTAWKVSAFRVILVHIFPNWNWIRENADQNNSEYGHFLRCVIFLNLFSTHKKYQNGNLHYFLVFSISLFISKYNILLYCF